MSGGSRVVARHHRWRRLMLKAACDIKRRLQNAYQRRGKSNLYKKKYHGAYHSLKHGDDLKRRALVEAVANFIFAAISARRANMV